MQLDIITPEKTLYSGEVKSVNLPGKDGYFGVLNHHSPLISALKSGVIEVTQIKEIHPDDDAINIFIEDAKNKSFRIEVKGGVVEIAHNKVVVLLD